MANEAFDLGFSRGNELAGEHSARKQQLADEQRQSKAALIEQAHSEGRIDDLGAAKAIHDLYGPEEKPQAIAHLKNLARRVIGRKPVPVNKPQTATDAQTFSGIKTPEQVEQEKFERGQKQNETALTNQKKLYDQMMSQAQTPEQKQFIDSLFKVKPVALPKNIPGAAGQPYKNAEGKWVRAVEDGQGQTVEQPMPDGWQPKTTSKVGTFSDFATQAYGEHPTAEQILDARRKWAEAIASTTVGSHMIMVPQPDGSIKAFEVQTSSHKDFGDGKPTAQGKGPAPKAKSGGQSKSGPVKSGDVLGGRDTPVVAKAKKDYVDAVALADTAKSVSQHPHDAINQKRLAVQLERLSAGRFTTQALDYVIKAGWGNTLEQWANNPSTGELPTDVMRQLVDGANEYLHSKKAALDAATAGSTPAPKASGEISDDDFLKKVK